MEFSLEKLNISGNFSQYESKVFDRLKAEYLALLDGKTYEYYQEKKDLKKQGELNKKLAQIEGFYSNPDKRQLPAEFYVKALESLFGEGNLELMKLPDSEDLDSEYFDKKFPVEPSEEDKNRGLFCARAKKWNNVPSRAISKQETYGQWFMRAMKQEIEDLEVEGYTKVATELVGTKHYTPFAEKLLLVTSHAVPFDGFSGLHDKTFYRDDILDALPGVEKKIKECFESAGLPVPEFKVILTPVLIIRELAEIYPELTNNVEVSLAPVLNKEGFDNNICLVVGNNSYDHDGYLDAIYPPRDFTNYRFRLSVAFK